jgi:hypothetical protein
MGIMEDLQLLGKLSGTSLGMTAPGNIDLENRPTVKNPDGSISTLKSLSANFGQGETLLPTIVGGKVLSEEDAIKHFLKTGENLGTFESPEAASQFAKNLSFLMGISKGN